MIFQSFKNKYFLPASIVMQLILLTFYLIKRDSHRNPFPSYNLVPPFTSSLSQHFEHHPLYPSGNSSNAHNLFTNFFHSFKSHGLPILVSKLMNLIIICHSHFFHTVCTRMIRLVRGSCLDCRCGIIYFYYLFFHLRPTD